MNKVSHGFFSFTEITDPNAHAAYNAWHQLDHLPEQYPLAGIVYGQRWVSTPACRAARAVNGSALDPIHYVTCYLMSEPIRQTLDDFFALGAELHRLDRFFDARRALLTGPFRAHDAVAAPRVLVSAAAVPYRPHRGVYVVVEGPTADDLTRRAARAGGRRGRLGVHHGSGAHVAAMDRRRASDHGRVARRRAARGGRSDRAARRGPGRCRVRRAVRDDHPVAVGLVRH